jgi:putative ABC transport system ATP-binding protein
MNRDGGEILDTTFDGVIFKEEGRVVVRLENASKTYRDYSIDVHALKEANLSIKEGDFSAIVGPSGSGKSTLLHILGCLDRPSSGRVIVDGQNIENLPDSKLAKLRGDKFGFIFQGYNLIPRLTAQENVMLPALIQKNRYDGVEEKAYKLLDLVEISHRAEHRAVHLSGGEQQRVAVARALINDPVLILADEPTGALDSEASSKLMELLKSLNRERGCTIVYVTHDQAIANYADRLIQLKDGYIIYNSKREW